MFMFIWVTWGQQPGDVGQKQGFRKVSAGPDAFKSLKMTQQNFSSTNVSGSTGVDSGSGRHGSRQK